MRAVFHPSQSGAGFRSLMSQPPPLDCLRLRPGKHRAEGKPLCPFVTARRWVLACWMDLTSSDLERAQDFYGTVFGWTFESQGPAVGRYITASKTAARSRACWPTPSVAVPRRVVHVLSHRGYQRHSVRVDGAGAIIAWGRCSCRLEA